MADEADVYESSMSNYRSQLAGAQAQYAACEAGYDFSGKVEAAQQIARIRAESAEFHRMACEHAASMRPAPAAPSRGDIPTPTEAMKICGLNPNDPKDVATYNAGAQRLAGFKRQGMYNE